MMKLELVTRRSWLAVVVVGHFATITPLGHAMGSRSRGFGVIVNSGLMQGTATKYGVEIKSDSGRHLAGFAKIGRAHV